MPILLEHPPELPKPIRESLKVVVDYLWEDELRHYRAAGRTDPNIHVSEHVFVALCWLRTYFEGTYHHPQHYLPATEHEPDSADLPTQNTHEETCR